MALLTQWLLINTASNQGSSSAAQSGRTILLVFFWKGAAEYHTWIETEYAEIVDLACDAINHKASLAPSIRILPPPKSCWHKPDQLTDRVYEEVRYGGQEIDVDLPGSPTFDCTGKVAMQYLRTHEVEFRKET